MSQHERMRAMCLTAHGGPEALVYRTDMPVPLPGRSEVLINVGAAGVNNTCLLYTSPSPRDPKTSRMPSSA